MQSAGRGDRVAVKISYEDNSNKTATYGRQFDHTHGLVSKLTRVSIDALKEFFMEELTKEDLLLIKRVVAVTASPARGQRRRGS